LHRELIHLLIARTLKRSLCALFETGHFQGTDVGSIYRANQQPRAVLACPSALNIVGRQPAARGRWNFIDLNQTESGTLRFELARDEGIPDTESCGLADNRDARCQVPRALCSLVSHLDYSCGKETLANALPQFTVHGYDPAIPGLDIHPEPRDLFICTNVLEHVEPEFLDMVIDDKASVLSAPGAGFLLLVRSAFHQHPKSGWVQSLSGSSTPSTITHIVAHTEHII